MPTSYREDLERRRAETADHVAVSLQSRIDSDEHIRASREAIHSSLRLLAEAPDPATERKRRAAD